MKKKVNFRKVSKQLTANENVKVGDSCVDKAGGNQQNAGSILLDKTNSILNIGKSDKKTTGKVHFSSQESNVVAERKVYNKVTVDKKTKSLIPFQKPKEITPLSNVNIENNLKNDEDICSSSKKHVPIYKVPVLTGRESFRLTPLQVKDKDALYEFEVDENEPVAKKRRQRVRTFKRNRICKIPTKEKRHELAELRTIVLRNERQGNKARVNYNEISACELSVQNKPCDSRKEVIQKNVGNKSTVLRSKQIEQLIGINENVAKDVVHQESCDSRKEVNQKHIGNKSTVLRSKEIEQPIGIKENVVKGNVSKTCYQKKTVQRDNLQQSSVIKSVYKTPKRVTNCVTLVEDSVRSGNNSCTLERSNKTIDVENDEYNNDFVHDAVTASTPCHLANPNKTVRKDKFELCRVSGGEQFDCSLVREVDDDDECFGFDSDDVTEASLRRACPTKTPPVRTPSSHRRLITNEPLPNISVNEVINILKRDVYGDTKVSTERQSLITEKSNSFYKVTPDRAQNTYATVDVNMDTTFVNPPRRSYTKTPRKAERVVHYKDYDMDEMDDAIEEKVVNKNYGQKKRKISKKDMKEMERQAAKMNSQFSEIDKFSLVVE